MTPARVEKRDNSQTCTPTAFMVCAALLTAQGAQETLVACIMDAMKNSVKKFWEPHTKTWIEDPDWQLRSKIAVDVLHFLEGSPVKRSESLKLVQVLQGNTSDLPISLDAIKEPKLRAEVAALMAKAMAGTKPDAAPIGVARVDADSTKTVS